jgi:dUTP pyrophosphatase
MTDKLPCKLLGEDGKLPTRGSDLSAGYDLYSAASGCIDIGSHQAISTQLSVAIPPGYYGRIAPRSGLAYKKAIDVLAGVLDSIHHDEIKVILINHGRESYRFDKGDRIAQLVIEKIITPEVVEVKKLPHPLRWEEFVNLN